MNSLVSAGSATPAAPGTHPEIPDYELLARIGTGAYGEVWIARSVATGVLRAVKIVRRATFADDRPFEREFEGLRKFEEVSRSHPSQLALFHVGRNNTARYFYYVMELADPAEVSSDQCSVISGQYLVSQARAAPGTALNTDRLITDYSPRTLRSDLAHGRLPAARVLELGLALTEALAHLHSHGLVHRDIKPSNIIFVGGRPKLADIGLVTDASDQCSVGGTEGYIAPEGPGAPPADIFALGKVLYEALTGLDRRRYPEMPAEIRDWPDRQLVFELNEILLKACAADSRQRYAKTETMLADLRYLAEGRSVKRQRTWQQTRRLTLRFGVAAGVVTAVLLLVARYNESTSQRFHSSQLSAPASIFILPFRNEGTNQVEELIRCRMTDAMIEGLGVFTSVNVCKRKSSWSKLDHATLMRRAASELGARFVITDEATQNSNQFGLILRVLQTPDGHVVAQDSVRSHTNKLAALELAVLELVAKHVGLAIDSDRRSRIEKEIDRNVAAIDLFLQGERFFWLGTREGNTSAIEYLSRAVESDPNFVEAHMALAATYRELAAGDRRPSEMWAEIRKHSTLALRIDDTLSKPRYHLAWGRFSQDHNWQRVAAALQPLIDDGSIGANGYAAYLRGLGRMKEARREQDRAELEDSRNLYTRAGIFNQAFFERDYARAIQKAQETIAMYPEKLWGYDSLAQCHIELGEFDKALGELEAARRIVNTAWGWALTGYTYARMGRRPDAAVVLDRLRERVKGGIYVSPYYFALVYTGLGQDEAALDELERAYDDQCEELCNTEASAGLRTDPRLERLSDHPRFQALLKKVGLDEWPK